MPRAMPIFEAPAFTRWVDGEAQCLPPSFQGVVSDSRRIVKGAVYAAIRGERFDGHAFVEEALAKGAAAALVDTSWRPPAHAARWPLLRVVDVPSALSDAARAWRRRSSALIIGVTGSSGKTTVKEMIAAMLGAAGKVSATPGNLNNHLGLPLSLLGMTDETRFGVFELGSSNPGEIAKLADVLQPQIAAVTSIGEAHIGHFGSLEAIAHEKGALLRALPRDGLAVLDTQTEHFALLRSFSPTPPITVALQPIPADFTGEAADNTVGTLRVVESASGATTLISSGVPGAHNISNLLLSFAVARTSGVKADDAVRGMREFSLPHMRWQVVNRGELLIVNDAYNANLQSMLASLLTFMELYAGQRRVVVLGDMLEQGGRAAGSHQEIGRMVANLRPDALVAIGVCMCAHMVEAAVKAGYPVSKIHCFQDVESAVRDYCFQEGDRVLLKGSRGVRLERMLDAHQV